jgi:hypothetical protein
MRRLSTARGSGGGDATTSRRASVSTERKTSSHSPRCARPRAPAACERRRACSQRNPSGRSLNPLQSCLDGRSPSANPEHRVHRSTRRENESSCCGRRAPTMTPTVVTPILAGDHFPGHGQSACRLPKPPEFRSRAIAPVISRSSRSRRTGDCGVLPASLAHVGLPGFRAP